MSRIAIRNATIVTMNPGRQVLRDRVLVVAGDRIAGLEPAATWVPSPGDEILDARGRIVLPGFVNTHAHTAQQLGRGLADDVDLMTLLHDRVFPYESSMAPDDSYVSTLLFGIEQIANGTTTFADAGIQHASPTVQGITELGIRAAFCYSVTDAGEGLPSGWKLSADESIARQEEAYARYHGAANGRIRWWFGLRTLFNNSDQVVELTAEAARRLNTHVHMHLAQSPGEVKYCQDARGASPIRLLAKLGLLGPNLLAVHCLYTDDEEIDLMAEHGVKLSHNPAAGLKIMGVPRIIPFRERGVVTALGTDSGASNNRNSMPDEMWLTTLLQKGAHGDPAVMTAQEVLEMATIDGARALGWDDEIGSLEVGKKADLVVVDPGTSNMQPLHDPIANLVFCMKTDNIQYTMCDGVWLMKDRRIGHVDVPAVLRAVHEHAGQVRERSGIQLPARFPGA
ncbi:amidohydrolase family protein [Actinocrispum wychmicini]|uniref:5-methylthioadenosine/S-adenosylhomocysteine deaminase n=1 Tax=Actinocrispum wychmicini TaxID=1213861 RepID=A0A4R2JN47_9PSEU|nr:amidohydrolase [Actinocrispum wychmicini]TCO60734.1 5-methylthioadenosine/S-adenosylhomocysteine deaminase [Actinocrispum wychmicini]